MKGIILVNMGSPESASEMRFFLKNMFLDPAIIPAPAPLRLLLSALISSIRYKKSWEKYELIGGSPLKKTDYALAKALAENIALNDAAEIISSENHHIIKSANRQIAVANAFSYSNPKIADTINAFYSQGIREMQVLPLYPHFSFTTTASVIRDVEAVANKLPDLKISFTRSFHDNIYFIQFWKTLIDVAVGALNPDYKTILIFSVHSIPLYNIRNGDSYEKEIYSSADTIAKLCNLDYKIAFQSKVGRIKWLEPDTKSLLKELANNSQFSIHNSQFILVPFSFLSENLETLYDLDKDIIPYAKNILHLQNISRIRIPQSNPLLVKCLLDLIK